MSEEGLKVVDAFDLDDELRSLLRPGEMVRDAHERRHRLPRYFYEIPTYEAAKQIRLTPNFHLNELIRVDLKEAARAQTYPRYVPCAVRALAFYLQRFRDQLGGSVHIAVNGGYRSPGHKLAVAATPHMWGTAADIYRIGNTILKDQESIEKCNRIAREVSDDFWAMPYGHEIGRADDHVHLDLGYLVIIPREISEDRMELPQLQPRFAIEERRRGDRRVSGEGAELETDEIAGSVREVPDEA
ncbi:MAG TPA: hypothetical protein VMT00_16030 [Thermoanaerobaculia bacterium]|nr:hypothetical protein [Thermoanaerobaculia bacterium]